MKTSWEKKLQMEDNHFPRMPVAKALWNLVVGAQMYALV